MKSTISHPISRNRIPIHNALLVGSHRSPQYCDRLTPGRHVWPDSATAVAKDMVSSFPHIRAGLMVGIGGGIPQPEKEIDIHLGDVVVSEPSGRNGGVAQYDAGKATASGFELKGFLAAPPAALLNAVAKLKARHERYEPRIPEILHDMLSKNVRMAKARPGKPSYAYQGREHDRLFQPKYGHAGGKTCSGCDASQEIERDERDTTGSGDSLRRYRFRQRCH